MHSAGLELTKLTYYTINFPVCQSLLIDDVQEGVGGYRMSGDTTGSWF